MEMTGKLNCRASTRDSIPLKKRNRFPINLREILQLHEIHSALAGLEFRHERLRASELRRNLCLCETRSGTGFLQAGKECSIPGSVVAAFQASTSPTACEVFLQSSNGISQKRMLLFWHYVVYPPIRPRSESKLKGGYHEALWITPHCNIVVTA